MKICTTLARFTEISFYTGEDNNLRRWMFNCVALNMMQEINKHLGLLPSLSLVSLVHEIITRIRDEIQSVCT